MVSNMNETPQQGQTFVDAHVHIYDCFDVATLLSSAYKNFRFEAIQHKGTEEFTGVIFLTETSKHDWFSRLSGYADANNAIVDELGDTWRFLHTDETCSLLAESGGGQNLILIAGRQIVTKENLEVLALATRVRFHDGTPIGRLIMAIKECDAIPVIPWGVGKWLGKRGRILKALVTSVDKPAFYLGDNSGRPIFWPRPTLFQVAESNGMHVLPGTDPLPLASEELRCGSFGFALRGLVSHEKPGADIKRLIKDGAAEIRSYGKLEKPLRFIRSQVRMRLQQRHN